jgi:hypothetical protein
VPVSFVYGEHDWMQPSAGQRVAAATARARGRLTPYDCKARADAAARHMRSARLAGLVRRCLRSAASCVRAEAALAPAQSGRAAGDPGRTRRSERRSGRPWPARGGRALLRRSAPPRPVIARAGS